MKPSDERQTIRWDGIIGSGALDPDSIRDRHRLIDHAKTGRWQPMLEMLRKAPFLVNVCRPDGLAFFSPLHHAAEQGAPLGIIEELIEIGAWRTLREAAGRRAVDLADASGHAHLLPVLQPTLSLAVPPDAMIRLQYEFHAVIVRRIGMLVRKWRLRLPELEPLLEIAPSGFFFAVPGMAGGFNYELTRDGSDPLLVSESWSRVVGGSGQRHEIAAGGSRLVDEGFV